jgi:quercetin dioxygenase-like cupin family protein
LTRRVVAPILSAAIVVVGTKVGLAQLPGTRIPGGCDVPVAQRTSDTGCYLTATMPLPQLPSVPVFWHVYSYPSKAAADAVEKPPTSIVVESLGTTWLFAIGDGEWHVAAGVRVARIGPLPVLPAKHYTARFMEAIFPPAQGLQTAVHHHSGPEAWYMVSGAQCLRTPNATTVLRSGESGFVEAGPPMMLTSIGSETRRSLVLVLHDSEQPWMTVTTNWRPVASCPEK